MKKLLLAFAFIGFLASSSMAASISLSTSFDTVLCDDDKDCDKKDCKKKDCKKGEKKACKKGDKKACCSKKSEAKKACCSKEKGKTCTKGKKDVKDVKEEK